MAPDQRTIKRFGPEFLFPRDDALMPAAGIEIVPFMAPIDRIFDIFVIKQIRGAVFHVIVERRHMPARRVLFGEKTDRAGNDPVFIRRDPKRNVPGLAAVHFFK